MTISFDPCLQYGNEIRDEYPQTDPHDILRVRNSENAVLNLDIHGLNFGLTQLYVMFMIHHAF